MRLLGRVRLRWGDRSEKPTAGVAALSWLKDGTPSLVSTVQSCADSAGRIGAPCSVRPAVNRFPQKHGFARRAVPRQHLKWTTAPPFWATNPSALAQRLTVVSRTRRRSILLRPPISGAG